MKLQINFKKIYPHIIAVALFLILPSIYLSPIFEGKEIRQGDNLNAIAMSKEQKDYYEKTGDKTLWCSSMFSGMPSYQIYNPAPVSVVRTTALMINLGDRGSDIGVMFLYLLACYIGLIFLGCNPWLSIIGAIGFGFSSYNIIIIEAGHISKAWAMSMIIPILVGIMLCLRKKYILGGALFLFTFSLQLYYNHVQITYYTLIASVFAVIIYFIYAVKNKELRIFFNGIGVLSLCTLFAIMLNAYTLFPNQEYAKYTMRGGNELTITPNELYHDSSSKKLISSGLDIDYAFAWSYGIEETFTLLVPGFCGGSNGETVSKDSEFYKNFRQEQAPLYWGNQPFTSGPVYLGAIICFLFVLGLFVVNGKDKWWILIATVFFITLSWGKNLMSINEFLFNYLPLYNKFRVPAMALVGANALAVLMSVLALKAVFDKTISKQKLNKAIYWSVGIVGGLCLLIIAFAGSFSFTGLADEQIKTAYPEQWQNILDILISDRKSLLISDSLRSLLFIIGGAGLVWIYANDKVKKKSIILGSICLLILIDLWSVDKRYLNENNFVKKQNNTILPTENDLLIKQYATQFNDKVYRVFNAAGNPFNDAYTSAFHHSIGGYHGAKLRRYQDIIDFYLSHYNMNVINMLNARYLIIPDATNKPIVQRNANALGNAWFVHEYKFVENPNAEILALNNFDPSKTAIIDKRFKEQLNGLNINYNSTASIELIAEKLYNPEKLTYKTKASSPQLAVFSEIYYEPDWQVYIDGKKADYFRANYILRSIIVPEGEHIIEFKLIPKTFNITSYITTISSILLILIILLFIIVEYRKKRIGNKHS